MARNASIVERLSPIQLTKPADLIMRQIRKLLLEGALKAGDRLPSERELANQFGVGRGHVRDALRRLEFHGVLQTIPQSGTVVASLGSGALERLISNLLDLDRDDIEALTETRGILELYSAQLAAQRATRKSITAIRDALEAFRAEAKLGKPAVEEDLMFHLAIANATQNPVLATLIGLITPDIIRLHKLARVCEAGRSQKALAEHERIYRAIASHDVKAAARAMSEHVRLIKLQFDAAALAAIARDSHPNKT
ncbi:MAG TPA: FadR/GntR family transcriptional regulator [Usitatibacter sp.]|nr:FadR/GntR family transcriptional regulator [Usitatibacter sp.]